MPDTPPTDGSTQATQFESPEQPSLAKSRNVTKNYVFNQTGNIMIVWADQDIPSASVRALFVKVADFFVAMLMAISKSINPVTKEAYSIYNYNAIMNVLKGSGLFVHVTGEDIVYTTNSYGANFSQELIAAFLGLRPETGGLSFAQGMISSIGSAGLKIGSHSGSSDNKVANIIFICEYLLGMPVVSAIVVSCDAKRNAQIFKTGPCTRETATSTTLTMHKDTYLFAIPKSEKQSSTNNQPDIGENNG